MMKVVYLLFWINYSHVCCFFLIYASSHMLHSWKEVVCWPSLPAPMFAPAVVMAPLVPSIVTQTAGMVLLTCRLFITI